MITNTSIIVRNRIYNKTAGVDQWQERVIPAAHWFGRTVTAVATTGLISAAEYTIRIPSPVDGFVHPDVWPQLADKMGYWTLQSGDKVIGPATVTIIGWTDNRRGLNPHLKVVCK